MATGSRIRRVISVAIFGSAALLGMSATTARADIDVTVGINYLDSGSFGVTEWTASPSDPEPFTFDIVARGAYASVSPTNGIPSTFTVQPWSGGPWPSDSLSIPVDGPVGCTPGSCTFSTEASVEGIATERYPSSIYVSAFGTLPAGHAGGAGTMLDVDLTIQPFNQVTVEVFGSDSSIQIYAEPGDQGFAFGSIRLYDRTLEQDLNAFGAVNNPYAVDSAFLDAANSTETMSDNGLSYRFVNNGPDPVTHHLRLAATVSVFVPAPVPEPQTYAMLLTGLGLVGWRLRARRRPARG